jgi:hypothetical protein
VPGIEFSAILRDLFGQIRFLKKGKKMTTKSESMYFPVKVKKNRSNSPHVTLNFFIFSGLWGLITVGLAQTFAAYNIWIVVAGVLLFSLPIFLCGFYSATVC